MLQKGSSGLPVVRLQQLLAWLGYLPLTWQSAPAAPTANPVASPAGFLTTLQNPPAGAFAWRYPNIPAALHSLWQPGRYNVLVEGAVMSLQQADGLDVDGIAGPQVWNALMRDVQTHTWNPYGYSFALVSLQPPERFTLWHNGAVAVTCLANTGIPESPTMPGTYPVYLQFESQTMRGTDPWGHPYEDPGVPWVSYFDEGEAVHGFVRDSYGTPQSLGCVELPIPQAKAAFALMHLGTLVSVQK
ncbi:MAG: L,D-transpeptidase family protein [Alicyclobacillus sp.]|nr:L,D-transpeptidase family protein [Alicyclobacillus sp.]